MTKKAVLIGINYVDHPLYKLQGCVEDVDNMKNMLIYKYNYSTENIIILTDDLSDNNLFPTREAILENLKTIVYESSELEELWIHYSGHGFQTEINGNMESVIVPMDYDESGPIVADELFTLISKIKCPAILLFDSCHSGNICEMPWEVEIRNDTRSTVIKQNNVEVENPNIYVFGGCKEIQKCVDKFDNEILEHVGAFTVSFLKCLYKNTTDITILEFYKNILAYMKSRGFLQEPVLSSTSIIMDKIITKMASIYDKNLWWK
jgi:hypothetical protein